MREPFTSYPKAMEFDITVLLNAEAPFEGLFCLNPTTWELVYNLLKFYGSWRSRYYYMDENGDKLTITDEEFDLVNDAYQTALEELQMAGCEELAAAINNVAAALAAQSQPSTNVECVNGESVCVVTNNINVDGTDTETAIDGEFNPSSGNFPSEFASQQDYLDYKCQMANLIVDGIVKTMRGMGIFTAITAIGQVIAAGIAAGTAGTVVILSPLGFVALVAAVLLVLAAGLGTTTLLNYMADEIEANREDIVCRLYVAANTDVAVNSAIDAFEELFAAAILAAGVPGALEGAAAAFLGTVAGNLLNSDTLNQLFKLVADIAYAGADCSGCEEPVPLCGWIIAPLAAGVTIPGGGPVGSGVITNDGEEFTLDSVQDDAGMHRLIIMKKFYEGSPTYPAAPPTDASFCDCDADDGYSITNISGLPSNPTLASRQCASNQFGSVSWPGTGVTSNVACWLSIARSTGAGGAFSITMRVNP